MSFKFQDMIDLALRQIGELFYQELVSELD